MKCPECGKALPDSALKCNRCGRVFKEVKNNTENQEYLKKEKEKADKKAQKLSEKNLKKEAEVKKQSGKNKSKTGKKIIAVIAIIAVLYALMCLLYHFGSIKIKTKIPFVEKISIIELIGGNNSGELNHTEAEMPSGAEDIEYTFKEVTKEDAVFSLGNINIGYNEYEFYFLQSYSTVQNQSQLEFKEYASKKEGEGFDEQSDYYSKYFDEYLKEKKNVFDFSKPINSQTTKALDEDGKEISWQEYIRKDAIKTLTTYRVKFDLAQKNGITLTDDVRYQVYTHIEGLREAIAGGGYKNLTQYLNILFGSGCDEEFFKNELIREYISKKYDVAAVTGKFEGYSDDIIKKEYEANYMDYDYIDLCVYEVAGKDSESIAKKIASKTSNTANFNKAVQDVAGTGASVRTMPIVPKRYVDETYSEDLGKWAYSRERKANDVGVFKSVNGYVVAVLQTPLYTNENCIRYREIFVSKNDENGNALTGEKLTAAKNKAEKILNDWKAGSMDENSFIYYALSQSEGQSASGGGLVEYTPANDLDEKIKKWAVDGSRKTGDTELFETDLGYSIIYYMKNYGDYRNYAIRNKKATEDYKSEYDSMIKNDYALVFDSDKINKAEGDYITAMNKLYFGIGA